MAPLTGEMKWHVHRNPQKPGTLMAIGSILTVPHELESSLNYPGIEALHPDQVMDQTIAVKKTMTWELSKKTGGRLRAMLPVNPFVNAGGGVEADLTKSDEAAVDALDVRAQIILPHTAKEYINKALKTPAVVDYVKSGLWSRSLYLIVGVATCKGLVMNETQSRGRNFSAEADAGLQVTGVEAGAGVSKGREMSRGSGTEVQEECAFAYRVREFQYSKRRRAMKGGEDWLDGSMFSNEPARSRTPLTSSETEEQYEDVPEFDGFESDDEEISDE